MSRKTRSIFLAYLTLVLTLCMFLQCSKSEKNEKMPSSDFTANKSEYIEGETAVFTQKSSNAETFRWTLPDGTTQKGETVSYLLPVIGADATVQVKLESFSKSGTKSDIAVKNFPVKAATGNIMFWAYNTAYPINFPYTIAIKVDYIEVFNGKILNISPEPSCGPNPACALIPVKVGTHYIEVSPSQQTFTVQVAKDQCVKIKL